MAFNVHIKNTRWFQSISYQCMTVIYRKNNGYSQATEGNVMLALKKKKRRD